MTHPSLEIVHGSPFALRHDGSGHDPVDGSFVEEWVTVLQLIGDQFEPMRRFTESPSRRAILGRRYRLEIHASSVPPVYPKTGHTAGSSVSHQSVAVGADIGNANVVAHDHEDIRFLRLSLHRGHKPSCTKTDETYNGP